MTVFPSPTFLSANVPVVVIAMLSLAINPKLVGVGIFKVTSFSPLYIFPFAVIPEIVIAFAAITAVGFVN